LAPADALPRARQEPAAHALHAAAPEEEKVPTAHVLPVVVMVVEVTAEA
jgi:hypothetical protein